MNILYCGDKNIEDGLVISVLSLLKYASEPLNIFVMTMDLTLQTGQILPVSGETVSYLDRYLKKQDEKSSAVLIDATELFRAAPPLANMETRFTPCCMLRLYADQIADLPDRILYLDNDVVCRKAFGDFYYQDLSDCELAGVPDYYGKWFFRKDLFHMDYVNSGVLLLNLSLIRESGLFARCRALCSKKKMFMPDQSAINQLADKKRLCRRVYNEQRRLHEETVFQHFTTSFRFFPWVHTLTVKPWQIDQVHKKLKLHEYDDILQEYTSVMAVLRQQNGHVC
ncbi:MAG: hypothetical protein LUI14_06990 [Lachnospiraceae bacterium]|nr:hypothetical protein [Lachnospiraceae bacterium]MCD7765389.1 hypothetical protein [Lachnospiraceae bacterium]